MLLLPLLELIIFEFAHSVHQVADLGLELVDSGLLLVTLEAHPPLEPVASPLHLAVLEFARFHDLLGARASQSHGHLGPTGAGLEGVVQAAPGLSTEGCCALRQ